jgi:two-component system, sensor histidine kinase YesM
LQPIIENAFKYGLEDKKRNGIIDIRFMKSANILQIIIQDNGNGLTQEELSNIDTTLSEGYEGEMTAIINIHRRLRLKFGPMGGLKISKGEMGGLKIIINIMLPEVKDVQAVDC